MIVIVVVSMIVAVMGVRSVRGACVSLTTITLIWSHAHGPAHTHSSSM